MSELVREALRQYQQRQEGAVNTDLLAALWAVQAEAQKAGLDRLTGREIDAEIGAYRVARAKRAKA